MCMFIHFGYAPPSKYWLCLVCETESSGMRGSEHFGNLTQKHQAATSACFSKIGRSPDPTLPRLGGFVLDLNVGAGQTAWGFYTEQSGPRLSGSGQSSEFHCPEGTGGGLGLSPVGLRSGCFHGDRGSWEPELLRHLSLWREDAGAASSPAEAGGEGQECHHPDETRKGAHMACVQGGCGAGMLATWPPICLCGLKPGFK